MRESFAQLNSQSRRHQSQFENSRREAGRANGQLVDFGQVRPLRNPQWDAWFQALNNQGVTGLADESVGARKGMWAPPSGGISTLMDPSIQGSSVASNPSNQLNYQNPYSTKMLQDLYKVPQRGRR